MGNDNLKDDDLIEFEVSAKEAPLAITKEGIISLESAVGYAIDRLDQEGHSSVRTGVVVPDESGYERTLELAQEVLEDKDRTELDATLKQHEDGKEVFVEDNN